GECAGLEVAHRKINRGAIGPAYVLQPFSAERVDRNDSQFAVPGRWSVQKATDWYERQPWLVGCNYLPAGAINQLEMWQPDTFDPAAMDRELQWAEALGFNSLRVYLHDLVWSQDPQGLYRRMDVFLNLCKRHGTRPLFVFFDDCHHPFPQSGPQPLPVPGYHNSGWVNSPSRDVAERYAAGTLEEKEIRQLKGFVQGTLQHFGNDPRVLMWELYNEPGRGRGNGDFPVSDDDAFGDRSAALLLQVWNWAREVNPSQPLCSCADGSVGDINLRIGQLNSDIISFHCYDAPQILRKLCEQYSSTGRPALCTEYMARPDSTFEGSLPILKKYNIGAYNWGLVAGKSGTVWPWVSRDGKNVDRLRASGLVIRDGSEHPEPEIWFHDIYRRDGTPYKQSEVDFICQMTRTEQFGLVIGKEAM
ncbi:MAG: hypothetical protein AB7E95_08930, partial [Kiritimatiellales bacterium]